MKKNIGNTDKIIRILVAMVVAVLFFMDIITGTAGIVLLILGGILLVTGLTGFCGIYTLFGINTCKSGEKR